MVDGMDIVLTGLALVLGAGMVYGVSLFDLPGTSNSGQVQCTLQGSVGVSGTGSSIEIGEESFESSVSRSGPVPGLSFTEDSDSLSLFKAKSVEMTYTLNGPINTKVQQDSLGKISKIGGSKESSFKFNNLPEGSYVLSMDLNWNTGSDFYQEDVEVLCGGDR